jgi:WD40 repeat protein
MVALTHRSVKIFLFIMILYFPDGSPIMISGSSLGHIAVWNLEEKRLISQLRDAHMSTVSGMHTFHLEPLMVTNSNDNSLKVNSCSDRAPIVINKSMKSPFQDMDI